MGFWKADGERREKIVAIVVAAALHVLLIVFVLRMPQEAAGPGASTETTSFASRHRDVPIPPEGIVVDSLPLSGLQAGENVQYEVALDCVYEVEPGSTEGVLRSGAPDSAGVLGCPRALALVNLPVPFGVSAHYDARGRLLGVVAQHTTPQTFTLINNLGLARPRPGRQWQGAVLIRIRIVLPE